MVHWGCIDVASLFLCRIFMFILDDHIHDSTMSTCLLDRGVTNASVKNSCTTPLMSFCCQQTIFERFLQDTCQIKWFKSAGIPSSWIPLPFSLMCFEVNPRLFDCSNFVVAIFLFFCSFIDCCHCHLLTRLKHWIGKETIPIQYDSTMNGLNCQIYFKKVLSISLFRKNSVWKLFALLLSTKQLFV